MTLPEVDVVLATYNGAKFLSEQLESIARQNNVLVNLIVSDDGSTDESLDIVKKYRNRFNSLRIYHGPKSGPSDNFFYMLTLANSKYVALSDQDDVWDLNHLISSISDLRVNEDVAALRFTKTLEFNSVTNINDIWPSYNSLPTFITSIMENTARGCTFVMNKRATNLINAYKPMHAVMHDWWIFLQIQINGIVMFSPVPEVHYRLHAENFVGHGHKSKKRKLKSFNDAIKGQWKPLLQAKELLELNLKADNLQRRELEYIVSIACRKYFHRIVHVVFKLPRLRSDFYSEIAARILLLIHRRIELKQ